MIVHGVCSKLGYVNEVDAMLALNRLGATRDGLEKTERSYYPCDRCGLFHLTSWRIDE